METRRLPRLQEALELAERLEENAAELGADDRPPLTDTLALWLAARYAVATRLVAQTEGPEGWRLLRELCADVVELRRGDHSAERLRIEQERLELEQEEVRARTDEERWAWAMQPEIQNKICGPPLSEEERMRRYRQIFGMDPDAPFPGSNTAAESTQDDSSPTTQEEAE